MKRRQRPGDLDGPEPPAVLLVFDADDWSGVDDAERWEVWRRARLDRLRRHGWPGGEHGEISTLGDAPWSPV